VIWDPQMRAAVGQMAVVVAKARDLKVDLTRISLRSDISAAIGDFAKLKDPKKGLIVLTSTYAATQRDKIIAAVKKYKLTALYPNALYVRSGGSLSYGPPTISLYQQAGVCVGQVLKGDSVALNTNTAFEWCPPLKTLGLKVPDGFPAR
jgi:hypothetical protein